MRICFFLIGFLLAGSLSAQTIRGDVRGEENDPLIGATLYWANTTIGTVTDENGDFELSTEGVSPLLLVASYIGYKSDTISISDQFFVEFRLGESKMLSEVVVKEERDGVMISSLRAIKTEQITQAELGKAACCDLAGCFSTQTSVDAQTTNVVTNAKELRILGLSGVYTQVLIDGFPLIQGLTYTYGISSVPGTLVDNIYVSKGANSVLQGYDSISGQINVDTKEPGNTDKLYLNAYTNSFWEKQLNANYGIDKGKWSNLIAVHTVQPAGEVDRDNDTFLDVPKLSRYLISNNFKYGNSLEKGWHSRIGLRYLSESRVGGQMDFNPDIDKGSNKVYGQTVTINQPEAWLRTGYRVNEKHNIGVYASSFYQDQHSYFGTVKYDANQFNFYGNVQHEFNYSDNSLKSGISFRHLNLEEDILFTSNEVGRTYDGNYLRSENIIGVFAENTMEFLDGRMTWIAGLRADHHNEFGTILTPRTLVKYDATSQLTIRANVGTGWRTVNLFSENIGLLVSSRDIVFAEELEPEKALNMGVNFTQKFTGNNMTGFISGDLYRTRFSNQFFPDYDSGPSKAIVANFTDPSISNTAQLEVFMDFWKQFEFKVGYSFLDVYSETEGVKTRLPFNAKHKVLTTLGYEPLSKKYHIDMHLHWYGQKRLPNTEGNPAEFTRPDYSDSYAMINAQFTYVFKQFEIYTGCENIFDFRQEQPILSWENPFGPYFDTSSVWGPTRGREFYLGLRFKIYE